MQQIPLSQNQFALVDDADHPLLSDFRWCHRPERDGKQGYAVRHARTNGKDRLLYLHRQIMQPKDGQEVIFLNYDRLDCRKDNLRVVTKEEARRHHRVRRDGKSQAKGVRCNPEGDIWSVFVYRRGRCRCVGAYHLQGQALQAYERELKQENPGLQRRSAQAADAGNAARYIASRVRSSLNKSGSTAVNAAGGRILRRLIMP